MLRFQETYHVGIGFALNYKSFWHLVFLLQKDYVAATKCNISVQVN